MLFPCLLLQNPSFVGDLQATLFPSLLYQLLIPAPNFSETRRVINHGLLWRWIQYFRLVLPFVNRNQSSHQSPISLADSRSRSIDSHWIEIAGLSNGIYRPPKTSKPHSFLPIVPILPLRLDTNLYHQCYTVLLRQFQLLMLSMTTPSPTLWLLTTTT